MEMKIGCGGKICSSFSGGKIPIKTVSSEKTTNIDKFTKSLRFAEYDTPVYSSISEEKQKQFMSIIKNAKLAVGKEYPHVEEDDYKGRAEIVFDVIGGVQERLNRVFPSIFEKAGIPADTEFEFDYDINTRKAVVTDISDEKYREDVENVINRLGYELKDIAYASRIMNGYISSAYYSKVESILDFRYGQDIRDLYIDENGNLCGMNEKMRADLEKEKNSKTYDAEYYSRWHFPSKQPEELIKRLISDENITPNISHMGYGKNGFYTNDGDFKFGEKLSSELFDDKMTALRGTIAAVYNNNFDLWLNNEEKFY